MAVNTAPPPYVGFGIFQGVTDTLAQSTVPTGPLDRRVLDGLSGADYGALMSALRFLGLVDDERRATEAYRKLVKAYKAGPSNYHAELIELSSRYDSIIGKLDVEHGTAAELEKAFRDAGVSQGQMLTKTMRFYVKLLQELGVTVSPHITKPKRAPVTPRRNGAEKRARQKPPAENGERTKDKDDPQPAGFERLPIPGIAGAFIQYPTDLTAANFALFDAMLGVLRTYVQGRTGQEKKP